MMTYDLLTCAACSGSNLHHYKTEIYNRSEEDSETGLFVSVRNHEIVQSDFNAGQPKPAPRRSPRVAQLRGMQLFDDV